MKSGEWRARSEECGVAVSPSVIKSSAKRIPSLNSQLSTLHTQKRKKRKTKPPSSAFPCALLSLDSQNLTAVVGTASLAGSVGHYGLTALGANRNAGSGQLPVGATALIAAGLGHFTLRDSHGDTSLVKLLFTA